MIGNEKFHAIVVAAAKAKFGIWGGAQIREFCLSILDGNDDNANIASIAMCEKGDIYCVNDGWSNLERELKLDIISENILLLVYAIDVCEQIVSEIISPIQGAMLIAAAARRSSSDHLPILDPFVYVDSEMPARMAEELVFNDALKEEAMAVLSHKNRVFRDVARETR